MSRYELLQKFWVVNFFTKKLVLSIEKKSIIFACKFNLFSSYKLQFIVWEIIYQNLLTLSIRSVLELYRKISYFYEKKLHNFELKWNEMSRYELLQKFWVVKFFTKNLVLSIEKKSIIFACKFNLFSSYKLQFILSETIKQNLLTHSMRSVWGFDRKISYFYQKQLHNFELKWNEMSRYELLQKFWVVNFFTKKIGTFYRKKKHNFCMQIQLIFKL